MRAETLASLHELWQQSFRKTAFPLWFNCYVILYVLLDCKRSGLHFSHKLYYGVYIQAVLRILGGGNGRNYLKQADF